MLPQAHQGKGVELAIGEELVSDRIATFGPGRRVDRLAIGLDRHAAVLDAVELRMIQVGRHRGKHGFEAPAAFLGGMVVVLFRNRAEIDEAIDDRPQGPPELGEALSQAVEAKRLERRMVGIDRSAVAAAAMTASARALEGSLPVRSMNASCSSLPDLASV